MRQLPLIALIAALADNRTIGRENRLPWRLPADLQHFKRLTLGKSILMGRKTWESLPGLLPDRRHILLTRNPAYQAPGCLLVHSPAEAIAAAVGESELMVIGGAEIYRQMLPWAARLYLTLVHARIDGDAFFPAWEADGWRQVSREDFPADARNQYAYSFLTLERIQTPGESAAV
jgi:dihydrofolate reductase